MSQSLESRIANRLSYLTASQLSATSTFIEDLIDKAVDTGLTRTSRVEDTLIDFFEELTFETAEYRSSINWDLIGRKRLARLFPTGGESLRSDGTIRDWSTTGNDRAVLPGVWQKFNGTDQYNDLGSDPIIPATDDFTLCGWVELDTVVSNGVMFAQYASDSNNGRFLIQFSTNSKLSCFLGDQGSHASISLSSTFDTTGRKVFWCVRRSGETFDWFVDDASVTDTHTDSDATRSMLQTGVIFSARTSVVTYNTALIGHLDGKQFGVQFFDSAISNEGIALVKKQGDAPADLVAGAPIPKHRWYLNGNGFDSGSATTKRHATIGNESSNTWNNSSDVPYQPFNLVGYLETESQYVWDFGARTNYLSVPTISAISRLGTFSFSCWVRLDGDASSSDATLLEYGTSTSNRQALRLKAGSSHGTFQRTTYDGSLYDTIRTVRHGFQDGKWHHVIFSIDAGTATVFVDGQPQDMESVSGGALSTVKQIGYQTQGTVNSRHSQTDTRVYDRTLSASEAIEMFNAGIADSRTDPSSASDYIARWHPEDETTSSTVLDLTDNGYDLTWVNYDADAWLLDEVIPWRYPNIYAVGNSLTADAQPKAMGNKSDWLINESKTLAYHAANPNSSLNDESYLWGTALSVESYNVLMLQPFPDSPAQAISEDVTAIQVFVDAHPNIDVLLIHDGHAPASAVNTGTVKDNAYTGSFEYSDAYFDQLVALVQAANDGLDIRRTKVNNACFAVKEDIDSGDAVGVSAIGGPYTSTTLFRDSLHLNRTIGRYLSHHCCRVALGFDRSERGFPFVDNPEYGSAPTATMDYLDSVVRRVHS